MQRFDALEGMRAVLAWWVVVGHMLGSAGLNRRSMPDGLEFLRHGEIAVYVFMIISGFVITHLLMNKREPYHIYITRRFLRLWPVFVVVITVIAAMELLGSPLRGQAGDMLWVHWLLEATMLHGVVPDEVLRNASQRLGGPGWSISLEWQFYIIAPALLGAIVTKGWLRWTVVAVIAATAMIGALGHVDEVMNLNFDLGRFTYSKPSAIWVGLPFFAAGMASWWVMQNREKLVAPIAIGLIAAFCVMGLIDDYKVKVAFGVWALMFTGLLAGAGPLHNIFKFGPLRWTGEISYSTYITHMPVLLAVQAYLLPLVTRETGWTQFWWTALIAPPIILAVSAASYYGLEKPGIALGRTLAKKMGGTKKQPSLPGGYGP